MVGWIPVIPAQATETIDDSSTVVVYTVVVLLALLGVALIALAVWIWRATRPEPRLLAPLELMDDPAWRRQDPQNRRRSLDEVRPDDAEPLVPSVRAPNVDEDFDEVAPVSDFDDLTDPDADPLVIDLDDDADDDFDPPVMTGDDDVDEDRDETDRADAVR